MKIIFLILHLVNLFFMIYSHKYMGYGKTGFLLYLFIAIIIENFRFSLSKFELLDSIIDEFGKYIPDNIQEFLNKYHIEETISFDIEIYRKKMKYLFIRFENYFYICLVLEKIDEENYRLISIDITSFFENIKFLETIPSDFKFFHQSENDSFFQFIDSNDFDLIFNRHKEAVELICKKHRTILVIKDKNIIRSYLLDRLNNYRRKLGIFPFIKIVYFILIKENKSDNIYEK